MAPLAVALLAGAALAALAPAPAAGPLAARRLHLSRPGTASDSVPAAATSGRAEVSVGRQRAAGVIMRADGARRCQTLATAACELTLRARHHR